jgi:hypothetical protein
VTTDSKAESVLSLFAARILDTVVQEPRGQRLQTCLHGAAMICRVDVVTVPVQKKQTKVVTSVPAVAGADRFHKHAFPLRGVCSVASRCLVSLADRSDFSGLLFLRAS